MFDSKDHYENKLISGDEANLYLEEFKTDLSIVAFLNGREYKITEAKFFSCKEPRSSDYYSKYFEEFVDLKMLVVDKHKYRSTLGRKIGSKSWQYIPNTANAYN